MSKRQVIVEKIVCTLRSAFAKGSTIDDKKFVFEVCADSWCSERKAKEYIKVARILFARELSSGKSQIKNEIDNIGQKEDGEA